MDRNVRNNSYSSNGNPRSNHHVNNYNGKNRSSGGYNRISPTSSNNETPSNHGSQQEDLVNYIFDTWEKVHREERGGANHVRYYQGPTQYSNFVPFDLNELWGRIKRPQHNS